MPLVLLGLRRLLLLLLQGLLLLLWLQGLLLLQLHGGWEDRWRMTNTCASPADGGSHLAFNGGGGTTLLLNDRGRRMHRRRRGLIDGHRASPGSKVSGGRVR